MQLEIYNEVLVVMNMGDTMARHCHCDLMPRNPLDLN